MNKQELVERIESNTVNIEEVRKTLIEVVKHLDTYSDSELVEIKGIADKMKEMAMYE